MAAPDVRAPDRRLAQRRERILDAAVAVFREDGFERASIDRIIAKAGGSKATLYKLFSGKTGLFHAILARAGERIAVPEQDWPVPHDHDGVRRVLEAFGRGIAETVLNEGIISLYRLAVESARVSPDLGRSYFDGGPRQAQAGFARLTAALQRAGLLQIDDHARAAHQFFGMILDFDHLTMSLGVSGAPSKERLESLVHGAVDVFLAAYACQSPAVATDGRRAS